MTPQSPSKEAPWDLTLIQFSQSPSAAPSYFPESHWQSEISSLSKVILVLGKAWSHTAPNLGCRGLSHLGDLMFCQKTLQESWCMSRCVVVMKLQTPAAVLNHLNSFCRGMFKINTKFDADSLLHSLSHFKCTSPQRTCSLNGIHCPCWLVQWSCHCSCMRIAVHSPWLPGYIYVIAQIILLY